MTTKHIGCSNPRNFKEKIELLKMKEAASTANFAAAMRDAQEICQIAYAYDALPLSLDHSHLHGNAMDRSVLMKAHSLSDITDTGRQMASKHSDLPIQDNILRSKVIPVDRKRVCGGSTISSSHSGIYPIGSTVSNTSDERVNERVPTGVQTKEHISIKKEEEQEVTTSQTPNICPFSYNSIGSSTDSSFGYKRNTYGGHDSDYNNNNTSTNCSYASSWSTTGPFHHQHSTQKSCIENWSNECSGGVVGSHQQIQKNFSPYNINNNNDVKPHYQVGVHQKPHLPANPYLFSASHSDAEVAATSLNTQQSLANSSSQYTCESGYFSVGDSIGTPVGFRSFPPTNNLQHSKVPFSVNFTEQLGRTPTPYSVVDWRRTASDSSIHNTLSGIQLNPTDQYTYGGKAEKSHMFSPRPGLSSDHHYFRPACKLRGVEEENANTPLAPPMLDDTDTKRGCVFRRQRDAHLLDNSNNNNNNSNRFVHTEMLTNEPHVVPAKRPYTCSTDPHSNGFEAAASQMKICSPRLDNLAGGGGVVEQKNMDPTDASLKHKSWKMRSGVVYNPHNNLDQSSTSSFIRPTYQCLSSSAIPSDSKYAVEELTDPSRNCLSQENHHSFSNLHNYSSSLSSSSQQAASASADLLCRNNTINSNSSNMMMMTGGRSVPRMASTVTTTPTTSLTINNGREEITSMSGPGAGGGGSTVIRDNAVVTDDLFLRSTNDLDEYLQLPSLICKADESNNSFAARRDSCTMTAEILSTLSNVREEVSENSLSRRIPTEHNNDTQQQQRSCIYVSNAANSIPINTNTNITNNQRSDHLMRNLISTDPLSNNNTNNNNNYAYNNRCGGRAQQQSLHSHFIQSLHGGDAHADADDSITTMTTPITTAGTTLATITNSTLTPTTIYSSCLHHVGDKIGISMSPNDYRLLTDPRLANYVTDKETEAQLID